MKTIPQHTLSFLDSWLSFRKIWLDVPGFSVAIVKDGKLIFNHSYGYANHEAGESLTTEHLFHIASHSKTFTATALFQLQEQGKLRIDDAVVTYLPWLKKHEDTRWQQVTIRQLLSHSAGVVRDSDEADFWQLSTPFPDKERLHEMVLATALVLEPNSRMKYSNIGYGLLGEVVESVSGSSYSFYIDEFIIKPLKLRHTTCDFDESRLYTTPYSRSTPAHVQHPLPHAPANALASATGFCSTAEDLALYFSAHIVASEKLLTDASKREMQRPQWPVEGEDEWYCLGLEKKEWNGRMLYGHSGGYPGGVSISRFDPTDGLVVSVVTNGNDGAPGWIAASVYSIIDALGEAEPNGKLLKFEVRAASFWGVTEYVVAGNELLSIQPNKWHPFSDREVLEKKGPTTFSIHRASGFASEGETVEFVYGEDKKIISVVNAGAPEQPTIDGDVPLTWQ